MTLAPQRAPTGRVTKLGEDYLDRSRGITRLVARVENAVVRIRPHLVRVLTTPGGL